MARTLTLRQPLDGDLASARAGFVGDPAGWLPPPARWRGHRTWTVTLEAGPFGRTVDCRVGPVWRVGAARWRSLRWLPVAERDDAFPVERGLPSLLGELGLVEDERGAALVLHAVYYPPGGTLGRLADAGALQTVARRTGGRFLEAVAGALAAQGPDPGRAEGPAANGSACPAERASNAQT